MKAARFTFVTITAMAITGCASIGPVGGLEAGKLVRWSIGASWADLRVESLNSIVREGRMQSPLLPR